MCSIDLCKNNRVVSKGKCAVLNDVLWGDVSSGEKNTARRRAKTDRRNLRWTAARKGRSRETIVKQIGLL